MNEITVLTGWQWKLQRNFSSYKSGKKSINNLIRKTSLNHLLDKPFLMVICGTYIYKICTNC